MRRLLFLLLLMPLAACLGGGGTGGDPSPTVTMVDQAAADMEEGKPDGESTSGSPNPEPETTPEPMTDPESESMPTPSMTELDYWEQGQAEFLNVRTVFPATVVIDNYMHSADMAPPAGSATWEGEITGEINPSRPYLSDPRIALEYNFDLSSIRAEISYDFDGDRSTLERYGASVDPDGSFSSFDGLNPRGFDGAFYGSGNIVAGSVSTPRVHGTYTAE